jgi:hypothetical protein
MRLLCNYDLLIAATNVSPRCGEGTPQLPIAGCQLPTQNLRLHTSGCDTSGGCRTELTL